MSAIKLGTLPKVSPQLIQSFDQMPDDDYLKGSFCYRKRCYGAGTIQDNVFKWNDSSQPFYQSKVLNNYVGGVSRNFHPIFREVEDIIEKQIVLNVYAALPQADYKVGIHQIRIIANHDNQGSPTPEGIHQDGFNFVSIACINTDNVSGGISFLLNAQDHTKVEFEGVLSPGMLLVFSDTTFAHYTSNISPKLPGLARRDVVVATFAYLNN
jgi:hypothetical protein